MMQDGRVLAFEIYLDVGLTLDENGNAIDPAPTTERRMGDFPDQDWKPYIVRVE